VRADVAIKNGRFAKVGRVEGRGVREIDAQGEFVSPGWIDMMDQSGEILLKNGLAENKLREGVTTAIAGEGGTPVPSAQIDEYFKKLERQGISLNFGTYYSSAQAREEVMGDVAGKPTAAQMEGMRAHVAEAMRAGAVGIATALIYPPDSFQSTEDLIDLARVAEKYGGIYASHMRDESAKLLQAIDESIEIGEKTGIQVEIFHFKGAYAPGWGKLVPEAGRAIDAARARGVNIAADRYVYTAGGTGLDITVQIGSGNGRKGSGLQDPVRVRLGREWPRAPCRDGQISSKRAAVGSMSCLRMRSIPSMTDTATRASTTLPSSWVKSRRTCRGISCWARSRIAPWRCIS
jgi:N-acyl-D-amino-acid deacylase